MTVEFKLHPYEQDASEEEELVFPDGQVVRRRLDSLVDVALVCDGYDTFSIALARAGGEELLRFRVDREDANAAFESPAGYAPLELRKAVRALLGTIEPQQVD